MINNNNIQKELQVEEIKEKNINASLDDEEKISDFKEISYKDFLNKKKKNKKCCSCCCIYKTFKGLEDFSEGSQEAKRNIFIKSLKNSEKEPFTTFIFICFGEILYNLISIILYFFSTMFKKLKNKKLRNLDKEDEYNQWFDNEGFDLKYANIQPKYKFWYNLSIGVIVFLFFNIIISILLFIFIILQKSKFYEIVK